MTATATAPDLTTCLGLIEIADTYAYVEACYARARWNGSSDAANLEAEARHLRAVLVAAIRERTTEDPS